MGQLQANAESMRPQRRAFWMRQLHQWHWISSALCLVGLLLFALTGITLNHARQIEATPRVTHRNLVLPTELRVAVDGDDARKAALPTAVAAWLDDQLQAHAAGRVAEWSVDEVYLSLPRPGGDGWLSIDRASGAVEYELTRRGAIAYLNDLHKGRNAGAAWSWFLDVFALACLVFAITGLFLLKLHAARRTSTWPLVSLGLVLPVVLALIFIH
ncbi:PepSY-associated TM helix domain-containing protein [Rhodanobacter spathiphylli]|uniref:PepSY-associated TM helix family protein 7 n=1 Tax=Rhodanobacter spathiphylli B39 TaxID=1163407 RepID=I4W5J1_9GAMM|nr:PepSY-associated TM helix domain-containing protein [Rhodanobacter spathiphylli]EIL94732.1 PepSY-associated TM helix family protein 7 [Rhodanobacter spathiphylli B39]